MQTPTPLPDLPDLAAPEWISENLLMAGLLARVRQGEAGAFAALYDRTARWLLAVVRSVVRDGQAEDVLADTYLHVWRNIASYDPARAPPGAWLKMVARSRALDHLRREKAHSDRHQQEAVAASIEGGERRDCPEHLLSCAEERMMVHLSLSGPCLSPDERNVIGLAYFRDHTHDEIAGITGLPLGTVKSTMLRAQGKLRVELGALLPRGKPSIP